MKKKDQKKDDKAKNQATPAAGSLPGLDLDKFGRDFMKSIDLGSLTRKSPSEEALDTVAKALSGDKQAKAAVVDAALQMLIETDKEIAHAKDMGRKILKKFKAHQKGGPKS